MVIEYKLQNQISCTCSKKWDAAELYGIMHIGTQSGRALFGLMHIHCDFIETIVSSLYRSRRGAVWPHIAQRFYRISAMQSIELRRPDTSK